MSRGHRVWWRSMWTRPCAWRRCRPQRVAAELRWILLGLSVPLLAGIWWWTARRSRQTPGNAELRESVVGKPVNAAPAAPMPDPRYADSDGGGEFGDDAGSGDVEFDRPQPEPREWGVPPFEP